MPHTDSTYGEGLQPNAHTVTAGEFTYQLAAGTAVWNRSAAYRAYRVRGRRSRLKPDGAVGYLRASPVRSAADFGTRCRHRADMGSLSGWPALADLIEYPSTSTSDIKGLPVNRACCLTCARRSEPEAWPRLAIHSSAETSRRASASQSGVTISRFHQDGTCRRDLTRVMPSAGLGRYSAREHCPLPSME
jgi:hypothetical protein